MTDTADVNTRKQHATYILMAILQVNMGQPAPSPPVGFLLPLVWS